MFAVIIYRFFQCDSSVGNRLMSVFEGECRYIVRSSRERDEGVVGEL